MDLSENSHRAFQRALLLCPDASRLTAVHLYDASYELVLHCTGAPASRHVEYLQRAEHAVTSAQPSPLTREQQCVGIS